MLLTMDKAPCDTPLVLVALEDSVLAARLARMGLNPGDEIVRLDEEVAPGPVRIKGPAGEVVLAPGMAAKVIAHHDDGHMTPILEMTPGERGHVEGLLCGESLEWGLAVLGLQENDRVEMRHRIPPMEYTVLVDGAPVRLPEGAAAKVWGRQAGRDLQLCMAATGKPFEVLQLLGGERAVALLERNGIVPGKVVVPERVASARIMWRHDRKQIVVESRSGLRLYLRPDQARRIIVRVP
ncbi:MAG: FeoA domain-containing protein [Desulfovibrionaceae bacterium]|jgi:Fe2+ transport system protein FeoA|nr:FeoA domain-containing protein [Desulfovibrionaceae bacterium]